MTTSTIAENITHLIEVWEELARNPAELVFSKTFYHDLLIVADKVADAIEVNKPLDKWQKATIATFNTLLATGDLEVFLMQTYYPTQVTRLQQVTTANPAGQYNPQDINQAAQDMITEVRNPTYLTNVCQEIGRVCIAGTPGARGTITTLVHVLLVRLVEQASGKMLQKHGGDVVTRTFLEMHSTELSTALQQTSVTETFTSILGTLSSAFKLFIQAYTGSGEVSIQERAANLAKHLIESDRDASMRIRIFFVSRMFNGIVFPDTLVREMIDASTKGTREQKSLITKYTTDSLWMRIGEQWFDAFAEEAILFHVRLFLEVSSPQHSEEPNQAQWILDYRQQTLHIHTLWKSYSETIADRLLATGLFGDFQTELPPFLRPQGRLIQLNSAKQALKRIPDYHLPFNLALEMGGTCSVNITSKQKRRAIQQMIRIIVREMLDLIKEAVNKGEIDASQVASFDLSKVLNRFEAQHRIIEQLRQWLELIAERFISSSCLVDAQKKSAFLVGNIENVEAVYHQRMVRRVAEGFGGSYAAHVVDSIQPAEVVPIVLSLVNVFASAQKQYQVTGIVDGLDLQGKTVRIGEVQLYDGRVWDYGEGNLLDTFDLPAYRGYVERYAPLASSPLTSILDASVGYNGVYGRASDQFVRHSARATVTIPAVDPKMAQQLAQIEMQQVLDVMTWSQTKSKESDFGPKFEMLPYYAVVVSDRQSTQITSDDAAPKLIALKVEGDEFERVAQTYHKLFTIPAISQTPVEVSALRALHWLGRGYWEKYPPDRFLNYWIAVEQLLVQPGQSKLGGVQSRLPDLVATWYHNSEGQEVLKAWRALLTEIENNPGLKQQIETSSTLVDWNASAAVLLRNLPALEQIDTNQALTSIGPLKALMDSAKITAVQLEEQEKLRYKIELLNRRRNRIVHDGFSYSTDMHYFTEALWNIVNRGVNRVLDRVGAKPGHFQTVDDVIRDYQIPF